ncbi:MarR family winged helix-turn-helix transcriptional regulator [Paenibacillus flagellatus]|uniref:MarR family transcriptional regulator n=1 Tax=Paenibacillus flagellatus TaxID=2211139 RepID=A0A2V5K046_9BACL|nr:MarR family transcriptional regulator [Paenibacillus flagellatus]PYI52488.1 MarR family transcriptional regulator [Paenibacillus flagellatus]
MEDKPLEAIYLELATLVRRATSSALDKKLGTLERSAFLLLHQLSEQGPVGVKTLSEQFRLDISTISRQTAALEAKGYVRRQPDPEDGRASTFAITELGMEQLTRTKRIRLERFAILFQDWTPDECRTLQQLLSKLNHTFID